jgi:prophage tail gpP-like protein
MPQEEIVVTGMPLERPDELIIVVGDNAISGWEQVEVTLRLEGFPNSFSIGMTSRAPITSSAIVAKAGDPCTILLGRDLVITGYVDRDIPGGSANGHTIQLIGRGKTQDLVDCSAEWDSGQMIQGNALDIATRLALPYGIAVELGDGAAAGPQVPQLLLNYTEHGADIIQRVARNAGLLAYENASGKLILGKLGTEQAASGITYGRNVQAWQVENSMDGRYSEICCCSLSVDTLADLAGSNFFDVETDPNVPRHRRMDMVLEQVAENPQAFTIGKARWEIARRAGRGAVVHATVDSWRDSAGALWRPNTLIPVDVPGMRGDRRLCLSEVTFRKSNESGTTAELMLMPPAAFTPEPISLLPINAADVLGPDPAPGAPGP